MIVVLFFANTYASFTQSRMRRRIIPDAKCHKSGMKRKMVSRQSVLIVAGLQLLPLFAHNLGHSKTRLAGQRKWQWLAFGIRIAM